MGLLATLGLNPLPSMAGVGAPVRRAGDGKAVQGAGGDTEIPKAPPKPVVTPPTTATGPKTPVTSGGKDNTPVAPGHEQVTAYADEHKAVKALLDALGKHAQASRVAAELSQVTTRLASAGGFAIKADWPKAMADLVTGRKLCGTAKAHADQWQTYRSKRAVVAGMGTALQGLDDTISGQVATAVSEADALMAATPPGFPAALGKLNGVDATVRPTIRSYADGIVGALRQCKAMTPDLQSFFAADIANGEGVVNAMNAAFAANEWGKVLMLWRKGWDVLGSVTRHGQRRTIYNTQRLRTASDIAAVKALPSVAQHGQALDATLTQADTLASRSTMKMEAGVQLLDGASKLCTSLKGIAPVAASYAAEDKAADTELTLLEQGKAAPRLVPQLAAIRGLLTLASTAAASARAAKTNPSALWSEALTKILQAKSDLFAAKALAAQMGPSVAADEAAAGGPDQIKTALAALKTDLVAAKAFPGAVVAKAPLDRCQTQAEATEAALGKKDAKAAGAALKLAATALAEGRTILMQHSQFAPMAQGLETNVAQLRALKTAKSIGPKIDPVSTLVAEARRLDAAHDGEGAMAALRRATEAVAEAKDADRKRTEFDALHDKIDKRQGELKDAPTKKAVADSLADAVKQADGFKFVEAIAALKKVLVRIDEAKLNAGMNATPMDPKLREIVKAMVANGGAASVDAAIQKAPSGNPQAITELASARYGKEFKFEKNHPGANEVKSMKRCCEVWATIPEDIVDNPSIKNFSHVDAVGGAGGGYTGSTGHIGMEGRVGIQQKFGKDETNYDPKTGGDVKALPDKIDKDCLPAKGDIEYLGFAAAHEVGHGVDDRRGFMAKNGSQEKYGGWIEYGGNVKPIADLIGAKIGGAHKAAKFYADADSKKYVLDKLQAGPAERPSRAILGSVDFDQAQSDAYDAFDEWHAMATANDVYRRQGDCDKIQIGNRIYHEAYPRAWVSYLASARLKGLTGYQFRAPAEWFAELYAGYKSGRLGKKHPALEWLKTL